MKKSKTEAEHTRRRLLDAALDVFYREGVAHAALQEIAAEAGVTRGALYWHFRNKEDLFAALFGDWFAQFAADLDGAAVHDDPWLNLSGCLNNMLRRIERDSRHYRFCSIIYLKCEHTARNRVFADIIERYRILCRERMAAALSGCPGGVPEAGLLFVESTLTGLLRMWLADPQRFGLAEEGGKMVAALAGCLKQGG